MRTFYSTIHSFSEKITKKCTTQWLNTCTKIMFNNQKIFLKKITRVLGTNLGIYSMPATVWTNFFSFFYKLSSILSYFFISLCGKIIQSAHKLHEKTIEKIRYKFHNTTVYFKTVVFGIFFIYVHQCINIVIWARARHQDLQCCR